MIVPDDEALAHARRMAVATWVRHRMTFRDLADDERLRARFDTSLVYSLGELWTAALVRAYGEAAIGDVLRALAAEGATSARDPREPEPGWTTMVRIRRGPDAGDTEVFAMRGARTPDPRRVEFRVPRVVLPAERFELLFSVTTREDGWPLAETWQWASAP